jgi:hypothetical protein
MSRAAIINHNKVISGCLIFVKMDFHEKELLHLFIVDILASFVFLSFLLLRRLLRIKVPLLPVVSELLGSSASAKEQCSDLVNHIQNKADDKKKLKHGFLFT